MTNHPAIGPTFHLTPHESVTVRPGRPEVLEVEVRYQPNGSPPPKHLHPDQSEIFEVLAGTLAVRIDGRERTLEPGDTLDVPAGAVHQMWNAGDDEVRAIWQVTPPGRTLEWFRALDTVRREGRVGKNGMPGPLALAVLLTEYRDVIRVAGPQPVINAALFALAALGRIRGHRVPAPAVA